MTSTLRNWPVVGNAPVAELDLARYTGKWHEIAHLPMYFQRDCITDITGALKVCFAQPCYFNSPLNGFNLRNRPFFGGKSPLK